MIELIAAAMLQQGPNDVFEAHDKQPGFHRGWDNDHGKGKDPKQTDCDGNAQQCPGSLRDCDADDPCASVREPPPLALFALGLGGLAFVWWRPRR
jgi:hypothetical protein